MTAPSVPTGNTYDKYGSANPVVSRLMGGFSVALRELLAAARARSILDVGCGEGVLTERWSQDPSLERIVGIDLDDPQLASQWELRSRPNLEFRTVDVTHGLPFADAEFDLVSAIEVLEHIPEPDQLLDEMTRVARSNLLLSVPREPLWRILNLARGAYLPELGNTPGHINHWNRRAFVQMLSSHGDVVEVRSPLPWTMLLVQTRRSC